jgi:uncharacterized membrane protein YedE/YeeE
VQLSSSFTPWLSLLGGALIGLAASVLLLGSGRIAGISGIAGNLVLGSARDRLWRGAFVLGLITTGLVLARIEPSLFGTAPRPLLVVVAAGLLVGFGTRIGSGCTSGHGVCGLSRLSPRSLLATLTFIAAGAVTVAAVRWLGGSA